MSERLTISHMGHHGDGLAITAQGTVSVPFTLSGEEILAELIHDKDHIHGQLCEVIKPSPSRIAPLCHVFGQCGGCRLQHMDDSTYRVWKLGTINHLLEKNSFTIQAKNMFVTPPASRRRVAFIAKQFETGLQFGFHKRESHDVVTIESCPLLKPQIAALIMPLRALLSQLLPTGQTLSIHGTVLSGIVELVLSGISFSPEQSNQLVQWATQHSISRLFIKPDENAASQVLLYQTALTARYGDVDVILPPAAFMQASDEAEAAMVEAIKPFFESSKSIADLFCGTGLFALNLYNKQKTVLAVDSDGDAIHALQSATQNLRGFKTMRRNLFREPFKAIELKMMDGLCLDPPRAGAKEQIMEIARSKISRIAYVSCNPITFMRDAQSLIKGGYRLLDVQVFDQFLWSHHIELIGLFTR